MLDPTMPHDKIIIATMDLAAGHAWSEIDLTSIAEVAGVNLTTLRSAFASRSDILKAFSAAVDREVLKRMAADGDTGDVARDRLFDTLMTRFEVLQPYKPALHKLSRDASLALEMMPVVFNTQRWMLEAAGISASGTKGGIRTLGTSAIYARVVRTWLSDDDAGQAKTMATLDGRLRSGEKFMQRAEDAIDLMSGFGNVIFSRRGNNRRDAASATPAPETPENKAAAETV